MMTRLLALLLTLAGPAQSDPLSDLLFAEGIFATLSAGQEIRYAMSSAALTPRISGWCPREAWC